MTQLHQRTASTSRSHATSRQRQPLRTTKGSLNRGGYNTIDLTEKSPGQADRVTRNDISEAREVSAATRNADAMDRHRALLFAHGVDEHGRRLALATDSMTEEEIRPHHVLAMSQSRIGLSERELAVYAAAERFDDEFGNVMNLRVVGGVVATNTSGFAFAPRRSAETHRARSSQAVMPRGGVRMPVPQLTTPRQASAASPAAHAKTPLRSREPGNAGQTRPTHQASPVGLANQRQSSNFTFEPVSSGALALAPHMEEQPRRSERPQHRVQQRPQLTVVSSRSRWSSKHGVAAFWTVFAIAVLFSIVIIRAGIAGDQAELDQLNVKLQRNEATNGALRVEVAELQSPTRVAEAARRLGLEAPAGIQFANPTPNPTPGATSPSAPLQP
jgi:cell division protein FtsL